MYFLSALTDFSWSLLLTALALNSLALPVNGRELIKDDFQQTIDKGLWFIEFFSPYCPHCTHFKPTWDKLVETTQRDFPEIGLAQVDCSMQGDLCNELGITGYPTMKLHNNGKAVMDFKGARTEEKLMEFLRKHFTELYPNAQPAKAPPPAGITSKPSPKSQRPALNPNGELLTLTPDTYASTLALGPAFVKFYAPWCGHCKKLAPVWVQLAAKMKGQVNIAEVNCEEHNSICKANNIQGYPSLIFFNGESRSEYNGGRNLESLKAFASKAGTSGVEPLTNLDELRKRVSEDDVVYLLLHKESSDEILDIVATAAAPLFGSPSILSTSSRELFDKFSVSIHNPWTIIAIKDHDYNTLSPRLEGTYQTQTSDITSWLLANRLPTTVELTRETFQSIMNAQHGPLVVIAATSSHNKKKIASKLRDFAKKWRIRTEGTGVTHGKDIVFSYMDGERWKEWLKTMYGIKGSDSKLAHDGDKDEEAHEEALDDVQVVIADHKNLVYYKTDHEGHPINLESSKALFKAVEDAATGKSVYHHSETRIERLARFLSSNLVSIETYVVDHPIQSAMIFFVLIGAFFYAATRLFSNDPYTDIRDSKGRRID